jgi:hypothetical protein
MTGAQPLTARDGLGSGIHIHKDVVNYNIFSETVDRLLPAARIRSTSMGNAYG